MTDTPQESAWEKAVRKADAPRRPTLRTMKHYELFRDQFDNNISLTFRPKLFFKPLGFDCEGGDRTTKIVIFKIGNQHQIAEGDFISTFSSPRVYDGDKMYCPVKGPFSIIELGSTISLRAHGPFTKLSLWGMI